MTLVLGIDPGTATTGYGLVRDRADGSLELASYGTIQTPA
ncbi:MAG TPA: crossover junction endodeoxyribonuclease RuvC, partial [Anaerolineales bacterium]|nr:crossover junction endodeoxyribonuclease RuvC [Anaerolineales bacterium]